MAKVEVAGETVTPGLNIIKLSRKDFLKVNPEATQPSQRNPKTAYVLCPCRWYYKGYNEKQGVAIPLKIPIASLYLTLRRFFERVGAGQGSEPDYLLIAYRPSEYAVWPVKEDDLLRIIGHVNDLKYLNGLLPGVYRFYTGLELVTFDNPIPIHPPNHQRGGL